MLRTTWSSWPWLAPPETTTDVELAARLRQGAGHALCSIRQDSHIDTLGAGRGDKTVQHGRVGVVDLALRKDLSRAQNLIARSRTPRL